MAESEYEYCKFRSPAGESCQFYRSRTGRIFEEFCKELTNRTLFSGALEHFECALLGKTGLVRNPFKIADNCQIIIR